MNVKPFLPTERFASCFANNSMLKRAFITLRMDLTSFSTRGNRIATKGRLAAMKPPIGATNPNGLDRLLDGRIEAILELFQAAVARVESRTGL
jgi:hypothetical protein